MCEFIEQLAPEVEYSFPHGWRGHPRSVLRRYGKQAQPRQIAQLLFAQEFGEKDEDDVPRAGRRCPPAVWLPRGSKPYIPGQSAAHPVVELAFLGSIEDNADLGPSVHIDLEGSLFSVDVTLGVDRRRRGQAVIIPRRTGEGIPTDVGDRMY